MKLQTKDNHETYGQKNNLPDSQTDHQTDDQTTDQQDSELVNSTNANTIEPINKDGNDDIFDENCDESNTITNYSNDNDMTRDQNVLKM